ncbi:hypothetical protein JMJ77_0013098, partial [Colletotrichum scovillei]
PGAIARAEVASKSPRQSGLDVLRASRCRFRICIPVPCGLRRLACFIAGDDSACVPIVHGYPYNVLLHSLSPRDILLYS